MGRKRNVDNGLKGLDPTCPQGHVLKRTVADGEFVCDACQADIGEGCCYYGCLPCDSSLCGGCYVKLATGNLDAKNAADAANELLKQIESEVADLVDHFELESKCCDALTDALLFRRSTWAQDIKGLWSSLELCRARNLTGLVLTKCRDMLNGTYKYKPPPADLDRIVKEYNLDADARLKLADLLSKRPETAEQDLKDVELRLVNCTKPSALVMTMIVCLQRGTKLPEPRQKPQGHRPIEAGSSVPAPRGSQKHGDQMAPSRDHDREQYRRNDGGRRGGYDRDDRDRGPGSASRSSRAYDDREDRDRSYNYSHGSRYDERDDRDRAFSGSARGSQEYDDRDKRWRSRSRSRNREYDRQRSRRSESRGRDWRAGGAEQRQRDRPGDYARGAYERDDGGSRRSRSPRRDRSHDRAEGAYYDRGVR